MASPRRSRSARWSTSPWPTCSLSTLEATGASEAEIWLYGSPVRVVHSEDLIGVESTVSWASLSIYAGTGAVAFLLASRFWRAFGG